MFGRVIMKLIWPGIRHKVENKVQYQEYLEELKDIREELGVNLKEELYAEGTDSPFYNPSTAGR